MPWGPEAPAGTTRVSVLVGMNGAVALNARVFGPVWVHDPLTGGLNIGMPAAPDTGSERWTATSWVDGTSVAPEAGVVDTTASALATATSPERRPRPPV